MPIVFLALCTALLSALINVASAILLPLSIFLPEVAYAFRFAYWDGRDNKLLH